MSRLLTLCVLVLGLAACGSDPGSRALSGGAIGAGTGAVIGSVTPVGTVPGLIIGGVGGAVIGAATTPLAW